MDAALHPGYWMLYLADALTQLGCRDLAAGVVVLIGTGGGGAAGALQLGVAASCPDIPEAPLHLLQLGRLDKHFISFGGPDQDSRQR